MWDIKNEIFYLRCIEIIIYLKRLSRESVLRIILIWIGPARPNLFSKTFVNSESLFVGSRRVRFELRSKVSRD